MVFHTVLDLAIVGNYLILDRSWSCTVPRSELRLRPLLWLSSIRQHLIKKLMGHIPIFIDPQSFCAPQETLNSTVAGIAGEEDGARAVDGDLDRDAEPSAGEAGLLVAPGPPAGRIRGILPFSVTVSPISVVSPVMPLILVVPVDLVPPET